MADKKCGKAWLPFLWIIVACAAAHLWCLGSQFYMDDITAIRDNPEIQNGLGPAFSSLSWTSFWYTIEYRLFGSSPVGFHAFNWLIHTAVACTLFGFGREFLKGKWPSGVALFAALLFAVHPLTSEIPNYARTQDLAWATLFSLLAGWSLLKFLRDEGWSMLVACLVCVFIAAISKGPGFFHAAMVCGVIGLAFMGDGRQKMTRAKLKYLGAAFVVAISVLWLTGKLAFWWNYTANWAEPRFIGHAYTLSRVFWEFAWRSVIPVGLCSDHQIAETLIPPGTHFWNIPDKGAMLAMAGILTLTAFGAFLAWRKPTRLLGVCLFLYAATILFRFLYLIPEFMPEYRIYPGLPWFCLGAAIMLTAVWKWMFTTMSPRIPAVILLGLLAFLSARRSFVWHDLDRLTADELRQYPAQGRAVWELQDRDLEAGKWQAVIDRQEQVWPEVRRNFIASISKLAPARELPSGHFSLAEVACMGRYARAVAHQRSPADGIELINQLEAYMRAMRIDPATNPAHWRLFARDKALVLETAGNYQAALDALKREDLPPEWPQDFERISKKLKAAKTGP